MANLKVVKGMQDLFGENLYFQKNIIDILEKTFELYGFIPLETPAMEYSDVLNANYGEEGDKLIYRVLNSGDCLRNLEKSFSLKDLSEKGLRYDLTVPMVRFVSENIDKIQIPLRRYQIQNVWRADRPQKGRFREFLQCDIDIVGSASEFCELELISIAHTFFEKIAPKDFCFYINDIRIFKSILKKFNCEEQFQEIFNIVDKIDKISLEKVISELVEKEYPKKLINLIEEISVVKNLSLDESIIFLKKISIENVNISHEIDNFIHFILLCKNNISQDFIKLDLLLARGLSYYTSIIFEAKPKDGSIGSVLGGGRYDGILNKIFSIKSNNISDNAVGISFGISRIISYIREKSIDLKIERCTKRLIAPLLKEAWINALAIQSYFHKKNQNIEIITDFSSLKKVLSFANKNNFEEVFILGEQEFRDNSVMKKNLNTGDQTFISLCEFES